MKIQVLFKVYGQFSNTFQDNFGFQGLFNTSLHFQVLFKPVGTLCMMVVQECEDAVQKIKNKGLDIFTH